MGKAASVAALIRAGCGMDQRVKAGGSRAAATDSQRVTGKDLAASRGHADTVAACDSIVPDPKAEERGKDTF